MHLHIALWLLAFCASICVSYRVLRGGVCVLWCAGVTGRDVRLCWADESVARPPVLRGPDTEYRACLPGLLSEELFFLTPVCYGHTLRKYAAFIKHYLPDFYCVLGSYCIKPSQIHGSAWEYSCAQQPPSLPDLSVISTHFFHRQRLIAPLFIFSFSFLFIFIYTNRCLCRLRSLFWLAGAHLALLWCEIVTLWKAGRLRLLHPPTTTTTQLPSVRSAVTATLLEHLCIQVKLITHTCRQS